MKRLNLTAMMAIAGGLAITTAGCSKSPSETDTGTDTIAVSNGDMRDASVDTMNASCAGKPCSGKPCAGAPCAGAPFAGKPCAGKP